MTHMMIIYFVRSSYQKYYLYFFIHLIIIILVKEIVIYNTYLCRCSYKYIYFIIKLMLLYVCVIYYCNFLWFFLNEVEKAQPKKPTKKKYPDKLNKLYAIKENIKLNNLYLIGVMAFPFSLFIILFFTYS